MSYDTPTRGEVDWLEPYGLLEKFWLWIWSFLLLLLVLLADDLTNSDELIAASAVVVLLALVLPQVTFRLGRLPYEVGRAFLSFFSAWHSYEHAGAFIEAFRHVSYEREMILADQWIFGLNPSVWLQQFQHPLLTEYLQIVYLGYFPLMLVVGIALLTRRRYREFYSFAICINLSIFALHVSYFLVPVRSPFLIASLPEFQHLIGYSTPLEGLIWTEVLRNSLLTATSMRHDCFPSGHTMQSLISIYYAWKVNRGVGILVTVIGGSIIFSTLYLRYHYAIDLVAGAAGALIWVGAAIYLARATWSDQPVPRGDWQPRLAAVIRSLERQWL